MADTMRSLSALTTLLADNAAGDISAQDLRDAVISTLPPGYAAAYISASTATDPADNSTWIQVAGTWTLSDNSASWSMGTNGQFQYDGAADREVNVQVAFSMTAEGNLKQTQFGIAKNGTIITPSIIQRYVSTGADVGAAAVVAHTDISNGEYLTFVGRNITDTTDFTATLASILITDLPA
jgi:hypothetical protein